MTFLIILVVICVFILFNNYFKLKKETEFLNFHLNKNNIENQNLRKEIEEIKKSLEGKTIAVENITTSNKEIEIIPEPVIEIITEKPDPILSPEETIISEKESIVKENPILEKEKIQAPILNYESKSQPRIEKPIPIKEKVYVESAFSKFIKKAEKQFADNWTGILGTAIMVLGIGYLSIYTALKVPPMFRVLILWFYAGLLVGSHYILQKKEKWITTGLWLRSAGASLFLFGCFGASQIPALTFVSNPIMSYALIALGIIANLYVGYVIKKQSFLSLHVILSMLVLCVIPEKTLATFILATITATVGIILSYKEKWEYHLLTVITAFIIFDIWFNAQGTKLSATENIIAILGIITVAGSCMFMQYRSIYDNTRFDKAAFITHLTNWTLFATGLLLHSTGSKFKTFVLFFAAIICFFIAMKARKKKIFWLYHLDGMVSFILFALSAIMLNDWNVGVDIIACILYSLILVCLFVVFQYKETLLHKIFLVINHIAIVFLICFSVLLITYSLNSNNFTSELGTFMALSVISILVPVLSSAKKEFLLVDTYYFDKKLSLNGLASIVFSLFVILKCNEILANNTFYYVLIVIALIWTLFKKLYDSNTFDLGRLFFLSSSIIIGLIVIHKQDQSYFDWIFSLGLFAVIATNWTLKRFYNNEFTIRFLCILGVNATLFVLCFKYLSEEHMLQIFSLFGIALINHEFLWLNFKPQKSNVSIEKQLYFFYYFFAFLGTFLLVINASEFNQTTIGLTCLGISIIEGYVLYAKRLRHKSELEIEGWGNFNFLNSELILLNALFFGFCCLQIEYFTVYLSGLSIIAIFLFDKFSEFKRYVNYSFALIFGCVFISIILAKNNAEAGNLNVLYLTQTLSILFSFAYYYLLFKSKKEDSKLFSSLLPYVQNFWIIMLLFIQVETVWLPLLYMTLALVNFWLISTEKIKIDYRVIPAISSLAIYASVHFSQFNYNGFDLLDWSLQLGAITLGIFLAYLLSTKKEMQSWKMHFQIVLNIWLSIIMFTQLEHKWLPVFWACTAILNLFLYYKKISQEKNISIIYYLLANLHLGFLSFYYYESRFLLVYLLIFALLATFIYLAYKWMEEFPLKNSLLIYPATFSIGFFLFFVFDKGILTFFWILEALGLLILGILLKEKYFRYVSLALVGVCIVRLMFFDLSNADFLIRALVLLGVGVVLLIMNSLFKKYKERFD